MKTSNLIFLLPILLVFNSCSCNPEGLIKYVAKGMGSMIGEGFLPSEEIRQLGDFQGMTVNLSSNQTDDGIETTIFLKLENGDPLILGNQPEILARKCAEIYLRDFENSDNYQQITVQFLQGDPTNPENFAMQEYTFETSDF
jgi:hypothetical protein